MCINIFALVQKYCKIATLIHMESPANTLGRKHKVSEREILAASWELFSTQGYSATTMAQIAEKVGIARRSLFNYFPHKEALLFPGIADVLDVFSEELLSRPHDEGLLESVSACMVIVDKAASDFEGHFIPTPEIVQAQSSPAAISYIREYTVARMRTVALERFSDEAHAEVKAGLVAAITAQILTEAINISNAADPVAQRTNVKVVLTQLAELFSSRA